MKKIILILALAAIFAGVEAYAQEEGGISVEFIVDEPLTEGIADEATLIRKGDIAPDFTLTMLDGTSVKMSDLRGKVVLVNFWATWCPPCRAELKRVPEEIIERFKGEDFVLLAISRGETSETVSAFLEKNGYDFNVGLDSGMDIYNLFAVNYIPRNYLVDRDGRVIMTGLGYSPEEFDEMVELIAKLVK